MTTRRLAAILAADVAGFSALMERDDEGTFARIGDLRREVIEPRLSEHQGRLIKTTGDGFLVEFASPLAALRCALAIQANLTKDPDALRLRIGLNLGDVIIEESGDVYGEGVNVAARLEGLAEPGGILISDKIYREVEGKVEAAFEDRGEQQVKNISRPVHIYAVQQAGSPAATAAVSLSGSSLFVSATLPDTAKPLPLPEKPSIAVLPFQNMSGDPEQEYFADGMVEDIITALSRFKSLFVIARNSSFTYKGKTIDIKQVGRELGVRYVLEGSVRKSGGRVRITGQLIEATTGAHLWADRFDGSLEDVFDLQDQVANSVVSSVSLKLEQAEIERAKRKPTESLDAYDYYLRGSADLERGGRPQSDLALKLFGAAMDLDPNFVPAIGQTARCYTLRKTNNWTIDPERETAETARLAHRVREIGWEDAVALSRAGFALGRVVLEWDEARTFLDRAVMLNPHLSTAWQFSGLLKAYAGESQSAIECLERAMRLSPLDPGLHTMQTATALAYFVGGDYVTSFAWADKASHEGPTFLPAHRLVAVNSGLLGRIEEARKAVSRMLKIDPNSRMSNLKDHQPLKRPEDFAKYAEGLRLARLPE
jgi:TolB-like protein/class 3 adenylate cyclase